MSEPPRAITGSAGSRIKLHLGSTGSDYLLIFDHGDGDREWQTRDWTTDNGGLPNGLAHRLKNMTADGRHVTKVAFGPNDEWFVSDCKRDGSDDQSWWDERCGFTREDVLDGVRLVSLGQQGKWVFIRGNNGWKCSRHVDQRLQDRIKNINNNYGYIKNVRLFPNGGFFISDDEGYDLSEASPHLSEELVTGGKDQVVDVVKAGDGSWVILRHNRFVSSTGVSEDLSKKLQSFYNQQSRFQSLHAQKMKAYRARMEREKREREETERQVKEAQAAAFIQEKQRQQKEERLKELRDQNDRADQIRAKGLKVGERVTVAGHSVAPGDFVVYSFNEKRHVKVAHTSNRRESLVIQDPRRLSVYNKVEEDTEMIKLLCFATDKYEAAISLYSCLYHGDFCECGKVHPVRFDDSSLWDSPGKNEGNEWAVGERVLVTDFPPESGISPSTLVEAKIIPKSEDPTYKQRVRVQYSDGSSYHVRKSQLRKFSAENPVITNGSEGRSGESLNMKGVFTPTRPLFEDLGEVARFDEYHCAEKIDVVALKRVLDDLQDDTEMRANHLEKLEKSARTSAADDALKKMQRCRVLELMASSLLDSLKGIIPDDDGCVVHEVTYEHRDASFHGRLFAKGQSIRVSGDKYPRTATLQGMRSDLRARLVGGFAHEVDCENSEVRLVCSLASQFGLESLVQTLIHYRDNRQHYLKQIAECHGVSESDAKRLPNIILCGGRYETWLRAMRVAETSARDVKKFIVALYAETHAIRDQLLNQERFRWTKIDREKLESDGKNDGVVNSMLMSRIVQSCENEVLGILHRQFQAKGWTVRAKVFDGLVVENWDSVLTLEAAMKAAEKACLASGWDVQLVEKPLHGLHNEPLITVKEAREAMQSFPTVLSLVHKRGPSPKRDRKSISELATSFYLLNNDSASSYESKGSY